MRSYDQYLANNRMAVNLHVHIGQAGNQIGSSYWQKACSIYESEGPNPLFHEIGKAAAVFVDSESKVIDRLRANKRLQGIICDDATCIDSSGRANNWAMGFSSSCAESESGHGLFHAAVNSIRREMERMDHMRSIVLFHSLAGGTGSGLGSAMLQYLREACPSLTITTCSIGPFSSGDTATQWYNASFALHSLADYADSIIYRDNDHLLAHYLKTTTNQAINPTVPAAAKEQAAARASMSVLNDSLAADLACLLFPTNSPASSSRQAWDANNLSRVCCPFPRAKFLDLRSTWSLSLSTYPTSNNNPTSFRAAAAFGHSTGTNLNLNGSSNGSRDWLGTGRALSMMLPTRDMKDDAIWTIAGHVTLRNVASQALPSSSTSTSNGLLPPSSSALPSTTSDNPYLPLSTRLPRDRSLATFLQQDLPRSLRLVPWQQHHHHQSSSSSSLSTSIEATYSLLPTSSSSSSSRRSSSSSFFSSSSSVAAVSYGSNSSSGKGNTRNNMSKALAICANRTHMVATIGRVLDRAQEMMHARAYLHWYQRYGIEEEDFIAAFEGLKRIIEDYGIEEEDFLAAFEGLKRIMEEYKELAAGSLTSSSNGSSMMIPPVGIRAVRDYLLK